MNESGIESLKLQLSVLGVSEPDQFRYRDRYKLLRGTLVIRRSEESLYLVDNQGKVTNRFKITNTNLPQIIQSIIPYTQEETNR